mmetsp:Transcript_30128/g.44645  ORF Transcript_30128/g.44645 Transcript_30128/m.44645 type:complete len:290 (+) Transcript_30128:77-946(+)|eukprot:CAMPEP_0195521248 /NCGR_PEP_ID=MMETSP0794_2-20130614/18296_1 /TAXON_ID=515487 /ORGANISM="Stephanopyxis turris, Strain CCMP 815" /LENGTH=289 /DNA_ID=CAMNT_0040650761 /DNA_START=46 /DNA_END=915 /DNA_ORIENTATION=-
MRIILSSSLSAYLLIGFVAHFNTIATAFAPTTYANTKIRRTLFSDETSILFLADTTTEQKENDLFAPVKNLFNSFSQQGSKDSKVVNEYDEPIGEAIALLNKAADTKKEDPEIVFGALTDLEKLMRMKRKAEPDTAAAAVLSNLNGDWRLIFTTGTEDTQKKIGAKINYFPIKALQSFDTTDMTIENGIYLGDTNLVKFYGDFEFDLRKSKVEFDFDQISIFGFKIDLGKGKAAEIGAASGLGSENNAKLVAKDKKPFFNWISADENIATARGGGGGLALWKRVVTPEE